MKSRLEIQAKVSNFREAHNINPSEPIKIKPLLLKLNVKTFFHALDEKISGISVLINGIRFMFINSNHSIGRQNFSVCHELYHLFVQENFQSMICNTGTFSTKNPIEYQADWFAAFLLMPQEGILKRIPQNELKKNKIQVPTLLALENYFGCSRTALLFRLGELNLIDVDKYEHLKTNVKFVAEIFGFGKNLYEKGRDGLFIGDYGLKAKQLYDNDIISESKFISLLQDIGIDIEAGESGDVYT